MWRHTKPMCVRGNIEAILRMPQHLYRSCSFAVLVPGCHLGLGNSPLSRPRHVHLTTLKIDLLWNWKLKRQWTSQQFIARVTWRRHFGGKQDDFKSFPLLISFYPSFWIWWCCTSSVRCISSRRYPRSGGGGEGGGVGRVIPYMAYTGMCRWAGYGFCPLCPKQDKTGYIILRESVLNRVYNL